MNKYTMSILGLVLTTAASASDLPSKSNPIAPVGKSSTESYDYYVGASFGSIAKTDIKSVYGNLYGNVRGGWEFSDFARVEADYDFHYNKSATLRSHTISGNVIGQYKVGFVPVTPYVLAGVGYRFADVKNEVVYALGAGVRYDVTSEIEADLRYRYITDRDRKRDSNVITIGANYKF